MRPIDIFNEVITVCARNNKIIMSNRRGYTLVLRSRFRRGVTPQYSVLLHKANILP